MPANTRELRRRIKSIRSIRQITKAMEMIAASKMRKAQLATLASRAYAHLAWEMMTALSGSQRVNPSIMLRASESESQSDENILHPLLASREPTRLLITLITANRGLCGAYNTQVMTHAFAEEGAFFSSGGSHVGYVTIGRKGIAALARKSADVRRKLEATFPGFDVTPTIAEIRPIAKILIDSFVERTYDRVAIVYADFVSTLQYRVRTHILLPVGGESKELGHVMDSESQRVKESGSHGAAEFLFEPSPEEVLNELLPRLIELQLYQAILEASASEHSARMVAMNNASDAAHDLIQDFTLTYNQLRQASITAELADITGGRTALKR